jgi:hypothetical protein
MKRLILMFLILKCFYGFSQGVNLSDARLLYFSLEKDQNAALKLNKLMDVENQSLVPVMLAYRGASSAASAGQAGGVNNKYNYFRHGRADLENAVRRDPDNPEIRFLRLATQTNAPGFLLYKSNINEDKKIVLAGLSGLLAKESERSTALKIASSLLKFGSLTAREKQIVNHLRLAYEQIN